MRLTVYTDFSLRVLMFLALKEDRRGTIAEIADAYGISKNHLMKVVHQLGIAGYLETVRGKGGGLRLAKPPQEIVLGEAIRRTEPDLSPAPSAGAAGKPGAAPPGSELRGALDAARAAFLASLDRHTLADLVATPGPLRRMLGIDAGGSAPKKPRRRALATRSGRAARR